VRRVGVLYGVVAVASMVDLARAMQIFTLKMDQRWMVVTDSEVRALGACRGSARPDVCSCFAIG
jgi:hypothetical protein